MKRSISFLSLVLVAHTATAQSTAQRVPLVRKPEVGQSVRLRVRVELTLDGELVVMTGESKTTTKAISPNGEVTETIEDGSLMVTVGGESTSMPSQAPYEMKSDGDGNLLSVVGKQTTAIDYRRSQMSAFSFPANPVAIGESWTKKFAANSKTGTVDGESTYKLDGTERIGGAECARITWTYTESSGVKPASAKGTMWIRISDGTRLKLSAEAKSVPIDEKLPPVDMKIEYAPA